MVKITKNQKYNLKYFIIGIIIAIIIFAALNYSNDKPTSSQQGELSNIGIIDLFLNFFGLDDDEEEDDEEEDDEEEDDEEEDDDLSRRDCEEDDFACAPFPYPEHNGCCADGFQCTDEGFECVEICPEDSPQNCGGDPENPGCCPEDNECGVDGDGDIVCLPPGNNRRCNDENGDETDDFLCGSGDQRLVCCDSGDLCNELSDPVSCCEIDQIATADGCEDEEEEEEPCDIDYECTNPLTNTLVCCSNQDCTDCYDPDEVIVA